MSSPLAQPSQPARRSKRARQSQPARRSSPARSAKPVNQAAADRLSIAHQRDVALVSGGVVSAVASMALGADPASIVVWFQAALDGMIARIQAGYAANRNSAMSYVRRHASLHGSQVTPLPGSLDTARLRSRLEITGPVAFKTAIGAGHDSDYAIRSMATQMSGVADEFTRNGDRDVVTRTAMHGNGIVGWRRRLSGRACGFCAMLASRGAVYVDRARATVAKDGMAYHPHCHCWAEPLYSHQQEPPEVRRLQRQWSRVTAGHDGKDAQRVWRQHWEQRATPRAQAREGMFAARSSGGRGFDLPSRPQTEQVRQILLDARTPEDVSRALADEYQRLTGRPLQVDLRGSVETAREHAEGILRAVERFPEIPLDRVDTENLLVIQAGWEGRRIAFDTRITDLAHRQRYLDEVARDHARGWHPYGSPVGTSVHEMGHGLAEAYLDSPALVRQADEILARYGGQSAARKISQYATEDYHEMFAEAFADVMLNGERAAPLSRDLFGLLETEYRSKARGALRLRQTLIEERQSSAALLAEMDELLGKKADLAVFRERLADELVAPGGYGVAAVDPALVRALREAVASGDPAKVRAAVTAQARRLKVKPIGAAGRTTAFDSATMRSVADVEIAPGTRVTIVRRGSSVTLPSGEVVQVEPALVTRVQAPVKKAAAKAVKAPAKVATPKVKAPTGRDILAGRDPSRTAAGIERAALDSGARDETRAGFVIRGQHGDEAMYQIVRRQGFEAPARVITEDEMRRLAENGDVTLVFRGVRQADSLTEREIRERFREGDAYQGFGVWGSGTYTSRDLATARRYGPNPLVLGLRKDARIAEWRQIKEEHQAFLATLDPASAEYRVFSDLGRYAAARGYDAMSITGSLEGEVLIFNRGAVVALSGETPNDLLGLLRAADRGAAKVPARVAKQAAAPKVKAPPVPERMPVASLRTELHTAGIPAELTEGMPKSALADWVRTVRGSGDAAAARAVEAENQIRQAAAAVGRLRGGEYRVTMADLRAQLPDMDRAEFDAAVQRLGRERGISVLVNENQQTLTALDRVAAVQIGPQRYDYMIFESRAVVPKPLPGGASPVDIARIRQQVIDHRKALGDALGDALEAVGHDASPRALQSLAKAIRAQYGAGLGDWPEAKSLDALVTAMESGDAKAVARAAQAAARKHKLTVVGGTPGKTATFDRATMQAVGDIRPGAQVVIVRPGYEATVNGERIVIVKPKVIEASEPTTAAKKAPARKAPAKKAAAKKAAPPPMFGTRSAPKAAKAAAPKAAKKAARTVDSAIDRSLSPADVAAQETRERVRSLSAPPVKYEQLPPRSQGGRALGYYQRNGDVHMNGLLRRGKVGRPESLPRGAALPSPEQVQTQISRIDQLMAESVLPEDITVYRGMASVGRIFPGGGEPGSLVGRTFRDKGFVSTSAERRIASDFAISERFGEQGVVMEVRVPRGTRAIQVSSDTFAGRAPAAQSEREILLDRNLRYRVVSDEMRDDWVFIGGEWRSAGQYRHVVVEVVQ